MGRLHRSGHTDRQRGAHGHDQARIEANERVAEERWVALEFRLAQIDAALERLEKRIWIGVYGVAAFLLSQMAEAILTAAGK